MSKKHHSGSTYKSSAILDIVIGTCGRFDLLEKCLDSVYREAQIHPVNLILIDNGSDMKERSTNSMLFEYQSNKDPNKHVNFLTKRFPNNMGFPASVNEGARMSHAPLIMFLSDDVELTDGVLDKVIGDFDNIQIGIVGIKLLFPLNSTSAGRPAGKVQHVGLSLNIRGDPIHPLVGWDANNPKCCVTREDCFGVTGACFTIRRNLFEKVNGFDKIFGLGTYEDMDMCMKVHQLGAKVKLDASAIAYHYTGATVEKLGRGYDLGQNNMIWKSRWMNSGLMIWDEVNYW